MSHNPPRYPAWVRGLAVAPVVVVASFAVSFLIFRG